MRKSRLTEQQIIGFLKQAESGLAVKEVCRQGGFSEPTFYKWRPQVRVFIEPENPRRYLADLSFLQKMAA